MRNANADSTQRRRGRRGKRREDMKSPSFARIDRLKPAPPRRGILHDLLQAAGDFTPSAAVGARGPAGPGDAAACRRGSMPSSSYMLPIRSAG